MARFWWTFPCSEMKQVVSRVRCHRTLGKSYLIICFWFFFTLIIFFLHFFKWMVKREKVVSDISCKGAFSFFLQSTAICFAFRSDCKNTDSNIFALIIKKWPKLLNIFLSRWNKIQDWNLSVTQTISCFNLILWFSRLEDTSLDLSRS